MFLSDVSIRRPILASIMNIFLITVGLIAYQKMGVSNLPKVDLPVVTVKVTVNGATPSFIEQNVINPIESSVRTIEGVDTIESTASSGSAQTRITFELTEDINVAVNNVRNAMYSVTGSQTWPDSAQTPQVQQADPNASPILFYAVTSETLNDLELAEYVDNEIEPELQQAQGVGNVFVGGLRLPEYDIFFDNQKLQSLNLTVVNLVNQIQNAIQALPGGMVQNETLAYNVNTSTIPTSIEDLQNITVQLASGQQAKLKDVARVVRTLQLQTSAANLNGQPALIVVITQASGANVVSMVQSVKHKITEIQTIAKNKVNIKLAGDNSRYITSSLEAVKFDFLLGVVLTVLIVFVFLHDWRSTLITSIAIPTSVIGAMGAMELLGFTLNSMTTLALSLSIGIIIDDAIVVIENIHRHLEMGKPKLKAAVDAMHEIGAPAIAITLAIFAVFMPVAFMSGITGRYFYEFALTVSMAVLISLFVAFTVTPSLGSRLLKAHTEEKKLLQPFYDFFNKHFKKLEESYQQFLVVSLKHQWKTIGIGVLTFVVSIFLLKWVPTNYQPAIDTSVFTVSWTFDANTSLKETTRRAQEIQSFLKTYPGVENVIFFTPSQTSINLVVILVDPQKRSYSMSEIQNRARQDVKRFIVNPVEVVTIGQPGQKKQNVQIVFTGDPAKVVPFASQVRDYFKTVDPLMQDIQTDEALKAQEVEVQTNYVMANTLGVTSANIGLTVEAYLYGLQVGTYNEPGGNSYSIVTRIEPAQSMAPDDIANYNVPTGSGGSVTLSTVADISVKPADSSIMHYNGFRQVTALANYTGSDLGKILRKVQTYVDSHIPRDVSYRFSGDAQSLQDASSAFAGALVLSFLFAYMVLCGQFESFLTPFVILLSVPLAFSGAFVALLVSGQPMSLYAMIGLILLTGLVKKNAILLLDFAEQHMRQGMELVPSLIVAGKERLRPILMTTFAMIFGMVPMAYSTSLGHEQRSPMGVAVIGGLVSSTLLTLMIIPSVFAVMVQIKEKITKKKHIEKEEPLVS